MVKYCGMVICFVAYSLSIWRDLKQLKVRIGLVTSKSDIPCNKTLLLRFQFFLIHLSNFIKRIIQSFCFIFELAWLQGGVAGM